MAKFKNLAQMQAWLEKNTHQIVNGSAELERVLASAMVESAWKYVYDAYEPEQYNRREDEGGLADERNYAITSVTAEGGRIRLIFENLTQGNDNMSHTFITDTIEEGLKENWSNSGGTWAQPRPFVEEAIKALNDDPSRLIAAVTNGLIAKGMRAK